MLYTILIFPKGKDLPKIEKIRKHYDSLFSFIQAHITLVFPSRYDCPLEEIFQKIEEITFKPFSILPTGFSTSFEGTKNYIFLRFTSEDKFQSIHDSLYQKIFGYIPNSNYTPHITLGCFSNKEKCERAYESLKISEFDNPIIIEEIAMERIEDDGSSTILYRRKV